MIRSVFIAVLALWVSVTTVRGAEEKPVFIALDAEFGSPNSTSAQSIKLGIDTAVREINAAGDVLSGRPLRLIIKDNRSMPARGIPAMLKFGTNKGAAVMKTVRQISDISEIADIEAPVGFGHGYDLTHILAKATDLAGTTNRPKVRYALERVTNDNGLVRYFKQPFSPDNHDALKREDVFMARDHTDGTIRPIKP